MTVRGSPAPRRFPAAETLTMLAEARAFIAGAAIVAVEAP